MRGLQAKARYGEPLSKIRDNASHGFLMGEGERYIGLAEALSAIIVAEDWTVRMRKLLRRVQSTLGNVTLSWKQAIATFFSQIFQKKARNEKVQMKTSHS